MIQRGMMAQDLLPISEGFDEGLAELVRHYLVGDPAAFEAAELLWSLTHVWDDLVDGDPVTPAKINGAFYAALIGLHRNAYWYAFADVLVPLLEQGIFDWLDSNALYRENPHAAFVLRGGILAVIIKMAELKGGLDWGREASVALRRYVFDDWPAFQAEHSTVVGGSI